MCQIIAKNCVKYCNTNINLKRIMLEIQIILQKILQITDVVSDYW